MQIEKLAPIAEIVSSVAIVATLAYLAVQTQQNTAALNASSRQQMLDTELMIIDASRTDPLVSVTRTIDDFLALSRAERTQLENFYNMLWRARESLWLQKESGALDEESWATYSGMLIFLISTREFVGELWSQAVAMGLPHPGFAAEINQQLDEFEMPACLQANSRIRFESLSC